MSDPIKTTERWYSIAAWNSQTMYGFGTPQAAEAYVDLLNTNRMINLYHADEMPTHDCAGLDSGDDDSGFALDLAIDTIRENLALHEEAVQAAGYSSRWDMPHRRAVRLDEYAAKVAADHQMHLAFEANRGV